MREGGLLVRTKKKERKTKKQKKWNSVQQRKDQGECFLLRVIGWMTHPEFTLTTPP